MAVQSFFLGGGETETKREKRREKSHSGVKVI